MPSVRGVPWLCSRTVVSRGKIPSENSLFPHALRAVICVAATTIMQRKTKKSVKVFRCIDCDQQCRGRPKCEACFVNDEFAYCANHEPAHIRKCSDCKELICDVCQPKWHKPCEDEKHEGANYRLCEECHTQCDCGTNLCSRCFKSERDECRNCVLRTHKDLVDHDAERQERRSRKAQEAAIKANVDKAVPVSTQAKV